MGDVTTATVVSREEGNEQRVILLRYEDGTMMLTLSAFGSAKPQHLSVILSAAEAETLGINKAPVTTND